MRRQQKHGNAFSLYRPVTPSHTRYCPVPVYAVAWQRPVSISHPGRFRDYHREVGGPSNNLKLKL
ncbi:hypothetical protein OHAE_52 [Ochrobactrum soli]|uniref:Uncharacterized protein n=1 Tax=Ochrobactrum soli TaxID=2448455 RepID=A0A2P9HJB2_9HYPH|nr:hypothetical protein OHAE_52 [[Ochrobactrum] soli]